MPRLTAEMGREKNPVAAPLSVGRTQHLFHFGDVPVTMADAVWRYVFVGLNELVGQIRLAAGSGYAAFAVDDHPFPSQPALASGYRPRLTLVG